MSRVLVTGGMGFIGLHLVSALGGGDDELLLIDRSIGSSITSVRTAEAITTFRPEVVYHLAAHHYIPWCEAHPGETVRTNVTGTGMVVAAAMTSALRAFVFASSAAVYGFSSEPISEACELTATDVYGWSKRAGENILRRAAERMPQVRWVAARLFNVAGDGDGTPHVIPRIASAVRTGEVLGLGNVWPRRDYVHVWDVVDALRFLAEEAPAGFEAFNVGTGVGRSVGEVLTAIADASERPLNLVDRLDPREHDGHLVAEVSKLRDLGWSASRSFDAIVEDALR